MSKFNIQPSSFYIEYFLLVAMHYYIFYLRSNKNTESNTCDNYALFATTDTI